MNGKLLSLASKLLKDAAEEFSNHGCNDLPKSTFDGWSESECESLCEEIRQWNSDGSDPYPETIRQIGDGGLMSFLSYKLGELAKAKP